MGNARQFKLKSQALAATGTASHTCSYQSCKPGRWRIHAQRFIEGSLSERQLAEMLKLYRSCCWCSIRARLLGARTARRPQNGVRLGRNARLHTATPYAQRTALRKNHAQESSHSTRRQSVQVHVPVATCMRLPSPAAVAAWPAHTERNSAPGTWSHSLQGQEGAQKFGPLGILLPNAS